MKTGIFKTWTALALLAAGWSAFAAEPEPFEYTATFNVTNWIPDGDFSGLADTREITGVPGTIADLNVSLNIRGGFNGDFYVHLVHESGFAVLLNRLGVSSTNAFGYTGSGLSITLDDDAADDVHWYELFSPAYNQDGQLLGYWQPDGRSDDPLTVDQWSERNTALGGFNGLNPNGSWTLYLADLSSGEEGQLLSWRLEMQTIPEPSAATLVLLSGWLLHRARRGAARSRL